MGLSTGQLKEFISTEYSGNRVSIVTADRNGKTDVSTSITADLSISKGTVYIDFLLFYKVVVVLDYIVNLVVTPRCRYIIRLK